MRAAAAKIVVERRGNLRPRRRRIAVEQRLGRNQNAAQTIAALARLLVQESLLQRMRLFRRAEPFDRCDAAAGDGPELAGAGFFRPAVDEHQATAALFEPAAEPG